MLIWCLVMPRILFAAALAALAACSPAPRGAGPLPHTLWVEVERWTPEVAAALAKATPRVAGYAVLMAEVTWAGGEARVARREVDWQMLRETGHPVGLVLRVEAAPPAAPSGAETAAGLQALAKSLVAEAETHGIRATELIMDLAGETADLGAFRPWAAALHSALAPLPLVVSGPHGWLENEDFRAMATAAGHLLVRMDRAALPGSLAQGEALPPRHRPAEIRAWVEQAARIGVPFRLTLPTSSELVGVGADGRIIGRSRTTRDPLWPADGRVLTWRSDPAVLAGLVAGWALDRPGALTGLVWEPLPVSTDRLATRWITLAAVLDGRTPMRRLVTEVSTASPHDVILLNEGELEEPLPARVDVEWAHAAMLEGDGFPPYVIEPPALEGTSARFHLFPGPPADAIPPGERRGIGWIHLDRARQPRAEIPVP